MRSSFSRQILFSVVFLVIVATPLFGQGRTDYFNVESPQVHPIEIAEVEGHHYLLVCNTPDNSVEIWATDESIAIDQRMIARVPTGLEPVSVRWIPEVQRFYTANFLGDSITAVNLDHDESGSLKVTLVHTMPVTDEPLDIAFAFTDNGGTSTTTLFVTHMTLDGFGVYDAKTLLPLQTGSELRYAQLSSGEDLDFDGTIDDIALKEPWTAEVHCNRLFMLGHKGGNTIRYDFDLYSEDLGGGNPRSLGNVGSTNWNMEFGSNGDLYLVGAQARNALRNEATVKNAASGFVKSMIYVIEDACTANPTIHRRDVNLIRNSPIIQTVSASLIDGSLMASSGLIAARNIPTTKPVGKNKALAQLTDVIPFERADGTIKLFVTAFSSDRLGVIEPDTSTPPLDWPIRRINISPLDAPMAGPRGMALLDAGPGGLSDVLPLLYVMNRLDNSVTIVDPVAETVVASFELANDPTPDYINVGRELLYSAKRGNGFNSCSSCHTDARTDALGWDLGGNMDVPIPREIMPTNNFSGGMFPGDKEFMVTQSLQGLLNWEVPQTIQHLYTNGPYHWRADRENFSAFKGAFESLLDGDEPTDAEMADYEEFINSVNYPPNPKQPWNRVYSGSLGDPDANDPTLGIDGDGALRGLKIYMTVNTDGFACQGCHSLPEGSDNVLTENIAAANPHPVPDPPVPNDDPQPMETAALRGLFQKEARLDIDGSSVPENSAITGYEGLFHTGLRQSGNQSNDYNLATINGFNLRFFNFALCGSVPLCDLATDLNQFLHEMDWGAGPIVGRTFTADTFNRTFPITIRAFNEAENQAEAANAGVAVQAVIAGQLHGFWFDLSGGAGVYRAEPSLVSFTRAELLALMNNERDRMVLISTPLGSERRVASPSGKTTPITGTTPTVANLLPMVTNDAYDDVASMSKFWDNGTVGFGGTHSHTVRVFQNALLTDGPSDAFGLCSVRHDAPRRFRVAGKGIRHGAKLHLFTHDDPSPTALPPDPTLGPDDVGQVALLDIELPLYATGELTTEGWAIWETATELEARIYYRLMTGRPLNFPGVLDSVTDLDFLFLVNPEAQPAGNWDPVVWNQHFVRVVNEDLTSVDGGWQAIRIEPGPDCSGGPVAQPTEEQLIQTKRQITEMN